MRSAKKQQFFYSIQLLLASHSDNWFREKSQIIERKLYTFLNQYHRKSKKTLTYVGLYQTRKFEVQLPNIKKWLIASSFFCVAVVDDNIFRNTHHYRIVSGQVANSNLVNTFDDVEDLLTIVIIPMVGYHTCGYRLGYGGGFFDAFLKKHSRVTAIGVAFREQEIRTDIFEPHDIKLTNIFTS